MGDLTDAGDLEGYDKTSQFIAHSLQLGEGRRHASIPVGIVPGNHDINRPMALEPGITTKFEPLNAALRRASLPPLPVEQSLILPIANACATYLGTVPGMTATMNAAVWMCVTNSGH